MVDPSTDAQGGETGQAGHFPSGQGAALSGVEWVGQLGQPFGFAPFDSAQREGEVVLVARTRKLLVLLNAMLRGGLRWDQLKVSTVAKIA